MWDISAGKFPWTGLPATSSIQDLAKKCNITGSAANGKKNQALSVHLLSSTWMTKSPMKSKHKLLQQTCDAEFVQHMLYSLPMMP